ncbi:MAG TPA: hypothetical protein VGG20_13915 [Thermoanaerobaculia bacterium]|jgi:hypothetical protein
MAKVPKQKPKSPVRRSGPEGLRSFLATLEKDRLVDLLFNQALGDQRLFRKLDLERSQGKGRGANLAAIRRNLTAAFDPGDVDSYQEVYGYAEGLDEAVDALDGLLTEGRAEEVIDLAEYALILAEEALSQVDDSDGDVYTVCERLQGLHLAACKKAQPDPEELARRLFAAEMRTEGDSFYGAAETYADLLGKKGRAVYRELAQAEWKKSPARKPGESLTFDARRSALARILESLAKADGDLEALVAVKSHDLSSAWAFLGIAQLYKEARKGDKALEWAEKGVRAFPQRTDSRLRSFLAGEYKARRRHQEALSLIWANFVDAPGLGTYKDLKGYAERTESWPAWREKALGALRDLAQRATGRLRGRASEFGEGPGSRLVEIFLWEKKVEEAWREAQRAGCSEALWLTLARQREGEHPEESLAVYQRQVESALQQVSQQGYEIAVSRLRQIRDVMNQLGKTAELAAYLASVRLSHKRKRNFMLLLDKARLS